MFYLFFFVYAVVCILLSLSSAARSELHFHCFRLCTWLLSDLIYFSSHKHTAKKSTYHMLMQVTCCGPWRPALALQHEYLSTHQMQEIMLLNTSYFLFSNVPHKSRSITHTGKTHFCH